MQSQYITKVYRQRIKRTHPLYATFDTLSFKSKNLYNLALYTERQYLFENNQIIPRFILSTILNNTEAFKSLPAKTSQAVTAQAYQTFNSFFKATKSYNKNPRKFTGKPKLPKYKDKSNGRNIVILNYQQLKIEGTNKLKLPNKLGTLKLPKFLESKGIQVKTNKIDLDSPDPKLELIQLRIIPHHHEYSLEFVYEELLKIPEPTGAYKASIDLGLDNFAAIAFYAPNVAPILLNGKGLKSYNHNFNKTLARLKSQATKQNHKTTNRIQSLYLKRQRYLDTWMHKASKLTVDLLLQNQVDTVIIGHNKSQKQNINLGHKTNQQFVQIPYDSYIQKLTYKCQQAGIALIETEESYTSGTSFLDNEQPTKANYNSKRRIYRGLFESNKGRKINSDVSAAFQILKKIYATQVQTNPALNLNPTKLNVS